MSSKCLQLQREAWAATETSFTSYGTSAHAPGAAGRAWSHADTAHAHNYRQMTINRCALPEVGSSISAHRSAVILQRSNTSRGNTTYTACTDGGDQASSCVELKIKNWHRRYELDNECLNDGVPTTLVRPSVLSII